MHSCLESSMSYKNYKKRNILRKQCKGWLFYKLIFKILVKSLMHRISIYQQKRGCYIRRMYINNVCIFHLFFSFCTNHPPLQIAYDNLNMCRTLFLSSGVLKFEWHKRNKHNRIMLAESDECHKRDTKCYGLQ